MNQKNKTVQSNNSYLVLKNLIKEFQDGRGNTVRAVDDVSFAVSRGEFVTLLGPSGCGKTTTLRMIAGFENQNMGDIFLDGRLINNVPAFGRNMPMVFQSYALFPHLTIFENIAYGLRIRKLPRESIQKDVAMACEMVNLGGLEKRYPGELSGGQQQRVALARAIVLKPEIMLFDEPLSNLDAKLRIQTRTEIKRVQQELGITAVYVTHDQSEALSISDTIVIMNKGKIVQAGDPKEIYNSPVNTFVSDFIGNANFFDAVVEKVHDSSMFVSIAGHKVEVSSLNAEEGIIEGSKVSLAVKPEALGLKPRSDCFPARVDFSLFLGPVTEYKIEFAGNSLTAILSNTSYDNVHFNSGDEVSLSFNKDHVRLYQKK